MSCGADEDDGEGEERGRCGGACWRWLWLDGGNKGDEVEGASGRTSRVGGTSPALAASLGVSVLKRVQDEDVERACWKEAKRRVERGWWR